MQSYNKYFRPEQKVQLRLTNTTVESIEILTLYFCSQGPGYLDLGFPYKKRTGKEYALTTGMSMELTTDSMGVGVKMTVEFVEYLNGSEMIRVRGIGELQAFQRRTQPRINIVCGVRFTRGQGDIGTLREHWLNHLDAISKIKPEDLPPFSKIKLNLSSSGFRMTVKPPVECGDLFLALLQLEPDTKPLCILCETVWTGSIRDKEGKIPCGMSFAGITEVERKKLETFIKKLLSN